eukprot:TRINITY_DN618_c0_g1_i1.p1 TRINITY_DN618_c0_g1~~TRINITY_DN618_c0_g1_i1.p1  ORF type:complete len:428 (-),score=94.93 TRINITY_DN618_c0_g1_i1:82-1365(-)
MIDHESKPSLKNGGNGLLSCKELHTLQNIVIDWRFLPKVVVSIDTKSKGALLGVEFQSSKVHTVIVEDLATKQLKSYSADEVAKARAADNEREKAEIERKNRRGPNFLQLPRCWNYRTYVYGSMRVHRHDKATEKIQEALSLRLVKYKKSPTMGDVLKYLYNKGITVLIVGGAVRDAVDPHSKAKKKLTDIDLAVLDSYENLLDTLKPLLIDSAKGANVDGLVPKLRSPTCWGHTLMKIGTADRYGVRVAFRASQIGPKDPATGATHRVTFDLFEDSKSRDFTVNTLWFDPVNNVVLDPLGNGMEHVAKRKLQPVAMDRKTSNTTVLRYYKMLRAGYHMNNAIHQEMEAQLSKILVAAERTTGDFFEQLTTKERHGLLEYIGVHALSVAACKTFCSAVGLTKDQNINEAFFTDMMKLREQQTGRGDR